LENLTGRDNFEDLGVDGTDNIKRVSKEIGSEDGGLG
jgi:hypothetical protein